MAIEGRGASVLEAVRDWAIQSQAVTVRCDPPSVLKEYSVANDYVDLEFEKAPSRD
jgi:hypothetical protein